MRLSICLRICAARLIFVVFDMRAACCIAGAGRRALESLFEARLERRGLPRAGWVSSEETDAPSRRIMVLCSFFLCRDGVMFSAGRFIQSGIRCI